MSSTAKALTPPVTGMSANPPLYDQSPLPKISLDVKDESSAAATPSASVASSQDKKAYIPTLLEYAGDLGKAEKVKPDVRVKTGPSAVLGSAADSSKTVVKSSSAAPSKYSTEDIVKSASASSQNATKMQSVEKVGAGQSAKVTPSVSDVVDYQKKFLEFAQSVETAKPELQAYSVDYQKKFLEFAQSVETAKPETQAYGAVSKLISASVEPSKIGSSQGNVSEASSQSSNAVSMGAGTPRTSKGSSGTGVATQSKVDSQASAVNPFLTRPQLAAALLGKTPPSTSVLASGSTAAADHFPGYSPKVSASGQGRKSVEDSGVQAVKKRSLSPVAGPQAGVLGCHSAEGIGRPGSGDLASTSPVSVQMRTVNSAKLRESPPSVTSATPDLVSKTTGSVSFTSPGLVQQRQISASVRTSSDQNASIKKKMDTDRPKQKTQALDPKAGYPRVGLHKLTLKPGASVAISHSSGAQVQPQVRASQSQGATVSSLSGVGALSGSVPTLQSGPRSLTANDSSRQGSKQPYIVVTQSMRRAELSQQQQQQKPSKVATTSSSRAGTEAAARVTQATNRSAWDQAYNSIVAAATTTTEPPKPETVHSRLALTTSQTARPHKVKISTSQAVSQQMRFPHTMSSVTVASAAVPSHPQPVRTGTGSPSSSSPGTTNKAAKPSPAPAPTFGGLTMAQIHSEIVNKNSQKSGHQNMGVAGRPDLAPKTSSPGQSGWLGVELSPQSRSAGSSPFAIPSSPGTSSCVYASGAGSSGLGNTSSYGTVVGGLTKPSPPPLSHPPLTLSQGLPQQGEHTSPGTVTEG